MSENYRPNRITSRKVWICIIIGLILLLMCLAITTGYFDPNQQIRPSFISFAKNLASALDNSSSIFDGLMDWLFEGIENLGRYLAEYVPWPPILTIILAFIAFCYSIFQILKAALKAIGKDDRAPFNWDLKSAAADKLGISKLFEKMSFPLSSSSAKGEQIAEDVSLKEMVGLLKKAECGPFLFLIDRLAPNDHFALFWNTVAVEIEKEGINSDRYYFQGDPRICYNDEQSDGVSLPDLAELHPDATVVLVGDGGMFIKKESVQLHQWLSLFEKWETRYILSPKNYFEWDKREKEFKLYFHILPAKVSSVQYLSHRPNATEASLEYDIDKHVKEHLIDYQEDEIDPDNTFVFFIPPILHWIQACSLYPSLHLDLTLEIGEQVFNEFNSTAPPDEQVPFSAPVILSVFELPWFREGLIPDAERAQLAIELKKDRPELSNGIRKFLEDFPCVPPPDESYPSYKHNEFTLINRWLNDDSKITKPERKEFKKKLNWMYWLGFWPDRFLFDIDGPHKRISKYVKPKPVRNFVFNFGLSGLGLTQHFINICWSIFSGLLLLFTYLLIIWLSRPTGEDICMPVTKTFSGDGVNPITVGFKGTAKQPVAAFIYGSRDGSTEFDLQGSNVIITDSEGTRNISSRNGSINTTLEHTDTLRFLIRDTLSITASDQFDISIMACLNDTVGYNVGCPPSTNPQWSTNYSVHPNPPVRHYWSYFGRHRFELLGDNYEYNGLTHVYQGVTPPNYSGDLNEDNCPVSRFAFILKDPGPNRFVVIDPWGRVIPGDTIPGEIIPGEGPPGEPPVSPPGEPPVSPPGEPPVGPPGDPGGRDTTTYIFDYIDESLIRFRPLDTITIHKDTLIQRDTLIRIIKEEDSLRIRDSINIIDVRVKPRMFISANIYQCYDDQEDVLVSAERIGSLRVSDNFDHELDLQMDESRAERFTFNYEYNVGSPFNLEFSLPENSPFNFTRSNSRNLTMINGKEPTIDLHVVDSSYIKSEVINLLAEFIVPCDVGNLLELKPEVADKFKVYYSNSRGQIEEIKHQRGNVCQNIRDVDFCNSQLQIEYEDKIIETVYLRNYEVLNAETKDASLDIQSQIISSSAIACL